MIPTSIDGTDITGATIDGQDVQEITVDGQTVFTAGPSFTLPVAYSNLVAWYPFDSAEYGGSNADDVTAIIGGSGDDTAYDGTVDGATYESSGGVTDINAGANSGAFDFDGDDYIEDVYSVRDNIGGGAVTVMAWINADTVSTGTYYDNTFYGDLNSQTDGQIYLHVDGEDDAVGMAYWDGSGQQRSTVDGTFSLNTWHHVAGKYDGTNITPYIDGQPSLGDTESGASGWLNYGPYIGAGYLPDSNYYFDGTIDDVRIYDTDLSDQQIQDIYDNTPHP